MKRTALTILLLILFGSSVMASRVLDMGLYLHKNDTVTLAHLSVSPGEPSRFTPKDGNYTFALIDERGQTLSQMGLDPLFYILSDPPKPTDTIVVFNHLAYYSSGRFFVVRHLGREIFRYELPSNATCNQNGRCDYGEDAFSCQKDCGVGEDGICQPFRDDVCDRSCLIGADQDCVSKPKKGDFSWLCLFGVGGLILALVAIAVIVFLALRPKQPGSLETKAVEESSVERVRQKEPSPKSVKKRVKPR
ncbi:MAG: hypothetical protein V1728_06230 [Candidatus Micrarchaeota archaeon]